MSEKKVADRFVVSHYFDFDVYPESRWEVLFEEFAECGASSLALRRETLAQMLGRPSIVDKLRRCGEKYKLKFFDAHGLWGGNQTWDLAVEDVARRPLMFEQHKLCMRILASLGVRTYTMHLGNQCFEDRWVGHEDFYRDLVTRSLEELLPAAEKEGMVLCIENQYDPEAAPDELLRYVRRLRSDALGICFDAGHAAIMADDTIPRDRDENGDENRMRYWHGRLKFQHNALEQLAPYVVTAHLHDNDGCSDLHKLIFDGVIDWKKYMAGLRKCPRLLSIQDEALPEAASIARRCRVFRELLAS
ncbi:MAG: sugar phosphate isomerase/epimerase [Lentisphaeria bacterium]|nr:sugar phosphate isomerase/epimerase [Lentisphaeria bacterium]